MFNLSSFVAECRTALRRREPLAALAAIVQDAVSDPPALRASLPVGPGLGVVVLCSDPDLTVAQLVSPPGFVFPPHDHRMLSVVGVYSGIEENAYYRRSGRGLVELERRSVRPGEVAAHGLETVHGISNGSPEPLAALHVYAGAFFETARSEWAGEPLEERPYDLDRVRRLIRPG